MRLPMQRWIQCWTAALLGAGWLSTAVSAEEPAPLEQPAPPALIVGIDDSFPPFEYMEDGEAKGFSVDLMRSVAEKMGREIEFRAAPWHEILAGVVAGDHHITPTMAFRTLREGDVDFSIATVSASYTAFVREDSSISSRADLRGKRILVQRDGYIHDYLETHHFDLSLRTVESPLTALRSLATGDADAALLLDAQGLYLIRQNQIPGLRTIGAPLATVIFRMAVPGDRYELLAELNEGLIELRTAGIWDRHYDHWFGVLEPPPVALQRALWGLAAAVGLIGIGFGVSTAWSVMLRKRVAAALDEQQRLEHELYQSQKMEALGRLAGSVAHDFNNFLTVILGNLALARADAPANSRNDALLAEADQAGRSAGDLTRQLLSFARGQQDDARAMTWQEATRQVEPILRRLAPSQVVIEIHLNDEGWPFHLDPAQAGQVVMNLVTNAYEAIPGSGVVELRSTNARREGAEYACLTVRDTGMGMDAETRDRIFEPFFTTKGASGAGLGLAGVDRIVFRSGGSIEVESEPGEGSTFRVWLPRADGEG